MTTLVILSLYDTDDKEVIATFASTKGVAVCIDELKAMLTEWAANDLLAPDSQPDIDDAPSPNLDAALPAALTNYLWDLDLNHLRADVVYLNNFEA